MNMKNYLRKSTFPLFESIGVIDGQVQHASWHEKRYIKSYMTYFKSRPVKTLFEGIDIPNAYQKGKVKLRISYNENEREWSFSNYTFCPIVNLQLVEHNAINYELKLEDRALLSELYQKRGDADDILIVRNGLLTDTSYGNITFRKKGRWFTPDEPLLEGTARARLLAHGKISSTSMNLENYREFEVFKMINALRDFETDSCYSVANIRPMT